MKKILFYIGAGIYPNVVGGMEVFNYYLLKSLRNLLNIGYVADKKYDFDENIEYIKSTILWPIRLFFPIQLFFTILFVRNKYDKIVFSYSAAHWIIWYSCYLVTKTLRLPYIVVIHHGKKPPIEKYNYYEKFFSNAEKVISVSDDIKKNFDSKYKINSKVIYPLVPFVKSTETKGQLRDKYGIPIDVNVICMVGSLKAMKNPDTLLEAVANMSDLERSNYKPYIIYAGTGQMLEYLRNKSKQLGIQDSVCFLGFVPKEQVGEIMKLSDIYVIASDFEGTSVSLLEAMYNKCPIVASQVPGITDTIKDNECCFYPVKDFAKLKQCILSIIQNKMYSSKISDAAYIHFQREYSYENVLNNYIDILSK